MNSVVNKDQTSGIVERLIYSAVLAVAMKLVQKGYIDSDMATYIAAGAVAAFGSAYAWWINRPTAILQAAANIPQVQQVVTNDAVMADSVPSEKVVSK